MTNKRPFVHLLLVDIISKLNILHARTVLIVQFLLELSCITEKV